MRESTKAPEPSNPFPDAPIRVAGVEWRLQQVDEEPTGVPVVEAQKTEGPLGQFARMIGASTVFLPANSESPAHLKTLWDGQPTIFQVTATSIGK